jgi:pilus assembly protein CpaD
MARLKSLPLLLAAGGLALTATAADARRHERHGPERGLDSLNQPVVQRTDFVLDLASRDGGLPALERGRLRGWFASLGLGYGDRIFVDEPYGPGPATSDVARVAAEFGLLLNEGAPITAGAVQPGNVRVVVSRSTASVPGCPFADNGRGPSSTSANYGCAVNSKVADPQDLVLGQAGSVSVDGTVATKAIKVYRETPPSGTKGLQDSQLKGSGH